MMLRAGATDKKASKSPKASPGSKTSSPTRPRFNTDDDDGTRTRVNIHKPIPAPARRNVGDKIDQKELLKVTRDAKWGGNKDRIRGLDRMNPSATDLYDKESRMRLVKKFRKEYGTWNGGDEDETEQEREKRASQRASFGECKYTHEGNYTDEEMDDIEKHVQLFALFETAKARTLKKSLQPQDTTTRLTFLHKKASIAESARAFALHDDEEEEDRSGYAIAENVHPIKSTSSQGHGVTGRGEWMYNKEKDEYFAKTWGVVNCSALEYVAFCWDVHAKHWEGDHSIDGPGLKKGSQNSFARSDKYTTNSASTNESGTGKVGTGTSICINTLREDSMHSKIVRDVRKMPSPVMNREFIHRVIHYKVADEEYLVLAYPVEESEGMGEGADVGPVMREQATRVVKVVGLSKKRCRVTVVSSVKFGGGVPTFIGKFVVPYIAMAAVSYPIKYFLKAVHMIDCDAKTATEIAHVVVDLYKDNYKNAEKALDFMMLTEFNTRWGWGRSFWTTLLKMNYLPALEMGRELKDLTNVDAQTVAVGFVRCVKKNSGGYGKAVKEYGERYVCVKEMLERYRWFEPMLLVFATRLKVHSLGTIMYRMCSCGGGATARAARKVAVDSKREGEKYEIPDEDSLQPTSCNRGDESGGGG